MSKKLETAEEAFDSFLLNGASERGEYLFRLALLCCLLSIADTLEAIFGDLPSGEELLDKMGMLVDK